jgi:hypothetical protein
MPMKLTGKRSLAYMGVEAPTPPNIVLSKTLGAIVARAPTANDHDEFNEGDLWMVIRQPGAIIPYELWYLAQKTGTALGPQSYWRQLYPGAGGGGGGNLSDEGGGIETVNPITGAINVYGTIHALGVTQNITTSQVDAVPLINLTQMQQLQRVCIHLLVYHLCMDLALKIHGLVVMLVILRRQLLQITLELDQLH